MGGRIPALLASEHHRSQAAPRTLFGELNHGSGHGQEALNSGITSNADIENGTLIIVADIAALIRNSLDVRAGVWRRFVSGCKIDHQLSEPQMFRRLHSSAILFALVLVSSPGTAQITVRKVPPPVVTTALEEDRVDLMDVASPPLSLAGEAKSAKLAELGLSPNSVDGEGVKLTVVSPRQSVGNLSLVDVGVTSAVQGSGWASVRGSAIARFTAEPGSKYLVDFSVGDLPGASTAGTRRFTARIYADGAAPITQEFTLPKGAQHVVMLVEAQGPKPYVVLTLAKSASAAMPSSQLSIAGGSAPPQFIFYSAEITRLK